MKTPLIAESPAPGFEFPIRRFSIAEYHRLSEVGILTEDDRVELLEGVISPKMVHSPVHDAIVSHLEFALRPHLGTEWFLRIQSSVTVGASEPEPDLALVRGTPLRYVHQHPMGPDIAMVIEVAETSIQRDRLKAVTYAASGIPVYWIVNLKQRRIEVYASPRGNEYLQHSVLEATNRAELELGFDSHWSIEVAELIPLMDNKQ